MEASLAESNFGEVRKHAGASLCEVMVAAYFAAIYGGPQLSGSRVVTRWTNNKIPKNLFCRSGPRDVEEQTTNRLSGRRSDIATTKKEIALCSHS